MTRARRPAFVLATALFAAQVPAEDEVLFRPEDDGWATFKPGTWLRTEFTVQENGRSTRTEEKLTLLKRVGARQTFRFERTVNGRSETTEDTIDAPAPLSVTWSPAGKETLVVDGTKIECRILERKHTKSDGETRSWRGMVDGREMELRSVATVRNPDGSVDTDTVTVEKLKDIVKIRDTEYRCVLEADVFEKKNGDAPWKTTARRWLCAEIPGGLAKREESWEIRDVKTSMTWAVTGFEAAKSE